MAELTREASEVLAKAMQLTQQERGLLIDQLIETLDDAPPDPDAEKVWAREIKRRVDEVRSGKVKTIPGDQVMRELAEEFPDAK